MHASDQVRLTGLSVTVRSVDRDGWPTEAEFRFDEPLESPNYEWYTVVAAPRGTGKSRVVFTDDRYIPVPLPSVGETITLDDLARRSPIYGALMGGPQQAGQAQ
jgi:hypothetical protein